MASFLSFGHHGSPIGWNLNPIGFFYVICEKLSYKYWTERSILPHEIHFRHTWRKLGIKEVLGLAQVTQDSACSTFSYFTSTYFNTNVDHLRTFKECHDTVFSASISWKRRCENPPSRHWSAQEASSLTLCPFIQYFFVENLLLQALCWTLRIQWQDDQASHPPVAALPDCETHMRISSGHKYFISETHSECWQIPMKTLRFNFGGLRIASVTQDLLLSITPLFQSQKTLSPPPLHS